MYVHCAQGKSRSSLAVMAYLVAEGGEVEGASEGHRDVGGMGSGGGGETEGGAGEGKQVETEGTTEAEEGRLSVRPRGRVTVAEALARVQAGRLMAQPNPGFMAQMEAFEKKGALVGLLGEGAAAGT